ncbi:MAG TPA: DUF4173 domain-containing protein [Gemmatimonadaceae bacterium]|nr:DUF4173 domain-containing protein [Gemmatimonadaceae bacterium]
MRSTSPQAVLAISLALATLGDWLLRATPWGINAALWGSTLALATAAMTARDHRSHRPPDRLAIGNLLLGTACLTVFALRDAEALLVWCALAFLAALALQCAATLGFQLATLRLSEAAITGIELGLRLLWQPILLVLRDLPHNLNARKANRPRRWPAIVGGLFLAVPIVLIFGALLRSADPLFARLTDRFLVWDLSTVASHVVVIAALTWLASGYLYGLLQRERVLPLPAAVAPVHLGVVQVAIPLGALALLLTSFAGLQARYLFGGREIVLETAGLTLAEYARRGFFELVAVSALVLVVLWLAHSVLDRSIEAPKLRSVGTLSAVLLLLVGTVMASAIVRLRLYMENFGLTEARVHAIAFMVWLAAATGWFAATVLRKHPERFLSGCVTSAFVVLLGLALANPQDLVARTNLGRATHGKELDAAYLGSLDADAVPAIAAYWHALDSDDKCSLWKRLLQKWTAPEADWRRWNLARNRAVRAVAALQPPACPSSGAPR